MQVYKAELSNNFNKSRPSICKNKKKEENEGKP
jgi:hypothetical protein